jgi:hypothetical protein
MQPEHALDRLVDLAERLFDGQFLVGPSPKKSAFGFG